MSGPGNGSRGGWIGALGDRVIAALPPSFLLLCLLNIAFLAIVLRFIGTENAQRVALMNRVLDSCVEEIRRQQ
jgi:hypothetical protein